MINQGNAATNNQTKKKKSTIIMTKCSLLNRHSISINIDMVLRDVMVRLSVCLSNICLQVSLFMHKCQNEQSVSLLI